MSVTSVGSSSAYSYSPTTTSSSSTSTSSSSTSSSAGTTAVSPYQSEYSTLQQDDIAELMQVSFGSQTNATSNVINVLGQAATLQADQVAQQEGLAAAQAQAAAPTTTSTSTGSDGVPTLSSITSASDTSASAAIQNYLNAPPGSPFSTYA